VKRKANRLASRAMRDRKIDQGERAVTAAAKSGRSSLLGNIFLTIRKIKMGVTDPAKIDTNFTEKGFRPKRAILRVEKYT